MCKTGNLRSCKLSSSKGHLDDGGISGNTPYLLGEWDLVLDFDRDGRKVWAQEALLKCLRDSRGHPTVLVIICPVPRTYL
ncbi:hypothetical protein ZIOFF_059275 [Zingiber officinale]|uniref:Uncharacterized protein n=1 Tax=Zingiber officinale TaxID=94328 RepID=A0A8J5KK48_ZINOF|nr:hypothetical protein ZIOFF_059275 [Zingiber officinale]